MNKLRLQSLLLTIAFLFICVFQSSCIQTKNYKVELTEKDKQEIIDAVAEKMSAEKTK